MALESKTFDYSMYYVYNPIGTEDLKKVRVVLNITNEDFVISIISEEEISPEDILNIINLVYKGTFKKIKLNLYTDCRFFCEFGGKLVYKVILSENEPDKITLLPVE